MISNVNQQPEQLRDGVETIPEFADVACEIPPRSKEGSRPDELLDEALMETFPASDPMASGRMD